MQLECPRCRRVLRFDDERPAFCSACGTSLAVSGLSSVGANPPISAAEATQAYGGDALTLNDAEPASSTTPEQLGGFRLLRRLGQGGMGSCYEAEELTGGRRVALKLIAPELIRSGDAADRFRQEGRLASLLVHPRCVFVVAADEEGGRPYIAMELMPGRTLDDLVRDTGPLAPDDAIRRTLDLLEGLAEAHRLGLIHRDVKPSNCFLDGDGRVKIGDFGLSKSLEVDSNLTQTGRFLGTPQYASPEQIKGDVLDERTDLYSAAATLYYALSGVPPHQHTNASGLLAKIVSEPPTPLRARRRELSAQLERAVMRGLERRPERRYRSAQEFRDALVALLPEQVGTTGLALRFGALMVDAAVLSPLILVLRQLVPSFQKVVTEVPGAFLDALFWNGLFAAIFGFCEGRWGRGVGKWLFRLRVQREGAAEPPGFARAWLRAAIVFFPGVLPDLFAMFGLRLIGIQLLYLGYFIPLLSMRRHNGFRGLHEIISNTRTVGLPTPVVSRNWTAASPLDEPQTISRTTSSSFGSFVVQGTLWNRGQQRVLVGEDPLLSRRVLIWERPAPEADLPLERRELVRPCRLRWLGGGQQGDVRWDAVLAPTGSPLERIVAEHGPLGWPETRPLLESLTDELAAADADHSAPISDDPDSLWVDGAGRLQLLDPWLLETPKRDDADDADLLKPVRVFARMALEGAPRENDEQPAAPRAIVPAHAHRLLARLSGAAPGMTDVAAWQAALRETAGRPVALTRAMRVSQLMLAAALVGFPLLSIVGLTVTVHYQAGAILGSHIQTRLQAQALLTARERDAVLESRFSSVELSRRLTERGAQVPPGVQWNGPQVVDWLSRDQELLRQIDSNNQRDRALIEVRRNSPHAIWGGLLVQRLRDATSEGTLAQRVGDLDAEGLAFVLEDAKRETAFGGVGVPLGSEIAMITVVAAMLAGCAAVLRGGLSFKLFDLALMRSDGRPIGRTRASIRALLIWLPLTAPQAASVWLSVAHPEQFFWCAPLEALTLIFVLVGLAYALWRPRRGLVDLAVGTHLVPA